MVAYCGINMRIFKTSEFILLLSSILFTVDGAPGSFLAHIRSPDDGSNGVEADNLYDQRQNGTENYRIHIDGVALVVAPIEALLLAGGIPGATDSNIVGISQQGEDVLVDSPKPEESSSMDKPNVTLTMQEKPPVEKSSHRPSIRLMSLLSPFLRKTHPHHQ